MTINDAFLAAEHALEDRWCGPSLHSEQFGHFEQDGPFGKIEASLARITVGQTVYWEVAELDHRPLDLRKHRWRIVLTLAGEEEATERFHRLVDEWTTDGLAPAPGHWSVSFA